MANKSQSIGLWKQRIGFHWAGFWVAFLIVALYVGTLGVLFLYDQTSSAPYSYEYLKHILWFTLKQATYSTVLSLICGFFFAHALFYLRFPGRSILIDLLSVIFVLPTLVIVFAVVGVYGHHSWLSTCLGVLGVSYSGNVYGMRGILIAHVLLNFPMAAQLFLQAFNATPTNQRKLASQLGIRGLKFFYYVEWPRLRQQCISVALLIFMLCFSSFSIVLTLGAGPGSTTLEVAIFQAVESAQLGQAAFFALFQWAGCLVLFFLTHRFTQKVPQIQPQTERWFSRPSYGYRCLLIVALVCLCVFLCLPLLNVLSQGVYLKYWIESFSDSKIYLALLGSTGIGLGSASLCLVFSYALINTLCYLREKGFVWLSQALMTVGMASLAMPILVLSVGLYLLLGAYLDQPWQVFVLLFVCNAIKTMPFVLRVLYPAMISQQERYRYLLAHLGLSAWMKFYILDWRGLSHLFKYAFVLSFTLSIGDFTVIAFFGHHGVSALPLLLYQELGHYHVDSAGVTACILLLYCLILFFFIQRFGKKKEVFLTNEF